MRIIGLDVGEKRIGVARADSSTKIAVPIGFINVDGTEWDELEKISRINSTTFFVLGLPRSNEGNETAQSVYVRNFASVLAKKIPEAKIRFQDESLTSVVAEERLKSRRKSYVKGEIDAEAASIILQDFIESFTSKTSNDSPQGILGQNPATNATAPLIDKPNDSNKIAELAKRETDKVKLKSKKVKHKMKTTTKWISGIAIIVILACIATGAALFIREQRYKEYAEMFSRQEAEMQPDVFSFTILPGETIYDIKGKLISQGFDATEVDEALNASYDYDFLKNRPDGSTLEGYLFGETHEFYNDITVKEIIDQYLSEMDKVIKENNLEARYAERGLSLHEGITLASVVQKEASPQDQPTVAQVFLTRLDYGIPLGSDVTVSYALDTIDPDRQTYTDNQAALTVDSCYNTRMYAGLPCGPISNPGLSALLAVAEPSDTSYLYFLTGDDGMMYYSNTESEHIQNTYDHCKELCNVSL